MPSPSAPAPVATNSRQRARAGFTLIEVMIVVAIIAILAVIAVPSYREYVLRSNLVDASNLLSTGSADMERYFSDNRTYAASGVNNPPCSATIPVARRTQGQFVLTCGSDATTFTLTATGSGMTSAFAYTIDQFGTKTTTVTSGPPGWSSGSTCWILKRGQAC